MLHKLAKFHYQTVFLSQVINKMFCFIFRHLMTSWQYHIIDDVIPENLQFDYFKNKKSFRSEIKNIFLVSQVLSFRDKIQTSKNVADRTFNNATKNFWEST